MRRFTASRPTRRTRSLTLLILGFSMILACATPGGTAQADQRRRTPHVSSLLPGTGGQTPRAAAERTSGTEDSAGLPQSGKASAPRVTITSVGDPVLKPGADLTVTARISNPGKREVTLAGATLAGQASVPASRNQLLAFIRGGGGSATTLAEDRRSQVVPPGGAVDVSFTVPRAGLAWTDTPSTWGPHGVAVSALIDGNEYSDRSVVVVAPSSEVKRMQTSVVVPVTASTAELSTARSIDQALSRNGENEAEEASRRVANTLSALSTPGVTAFVDPLLVESGRGAPTAALRSFAATAGAQLLLTPPGDGDLAAVAHACQAAGQLTQCSAASFATGKARAQSIAAKLASELSIPLPRTDVSLLAPGPDATLVKALAASGITGVVLPSSEMPLADETSSSVSALSTLPSGKVSAVTSDTAMSAAFAGSMPSSGQADATQKAGSMPDMDPLHSRQLVLALSAATYRERPNDARATVIQADRPSLPSISPHDPARAKSGSPLDPSAMRGTVEALMGAPWVEPATIDKVLTSTPSKVKREALDDTSKAAGEIQPSQLGQVDSALARFTSIGGITQTPELVTTPARDRGFQLTANAWRSAPGARSKALKAYSTEARAFGEAVSAKPSSTVNVISQETEIPLDISNSLPVPVTVTVALETKDQRLKMTKAVTATLSAHNTTKVRVPVKALGSGNITAKVRILDGSLQPLGSPRALEVRVRADWENIGTLVFCLFFFTLLIIGLVRSFRRGRRSYPISPLEHRRKLGRHST